MEDSLISQINEINYEFQDMVDAAELALREEQAKIMLTLYRKELARFNLKRHKVYISAAMGSADICVKDKTTSEVKHSEWDLHGMSELECTLKQLNALLDYDWAYLCDGEVLNKEDIK